MVIMDFIDKHIDEGEHESVQNNSLGGFIKNT